MVMTGEPAPPAYLDFAGFRLDVDNQLLLHGGESVALTPKAFDTLRVLIENRGQLVTKEALIEAVWPGAFITEATLSQNIYTLRKVLAAAEGGRQLVQTVPRRGYRFTGTVTEVPATKAPATPAPPSAPSTRPGAAPAADAAPDSAAIRSLAVLPLVPLGGGEDAAFLGLGLADAVIASLSHVQQLAVRATSTILRYVDETDRSSVEIGRVLGVDGVVEGTLQRLGSHLRVTVQLVSVARGIACWAESFHGLYDDLFEAQEAVAHAVVAGLRLTLTQQEEEELTRRSTESLDACRAYVRGRYFWNKRTAADLERAITFFRQAIEHDAGYAQAYAGLADASILLPFFTAALPADAFRQAREAARRAQELDGRLAEAHTSLAYTDFVYSRRWRTAEERFRRAIACNPHYPTAHHWYAFLLTALGRHDEAIDLATRAHELEPLSLVIHTDLALACYFARRYEEAIVQLDQVLEGAPDFGYAHFGRSLVWSQLERHSEAVAAARRAAALLAESTAMQGVLGYVLAAAGYGDEARVVLADLEARAGQQPVQASHRALIYAGLDERAAAFETLRQGCDERSRFVAFLGVWPVFDRLRTDARFPALLQRIGLRRSGEQLQPQREPSG